MNDTELKEKLEKIIQTLWEGNGQEAILPRMARIEEALEVAATLNQQTNKSLEKYAKDTSNEIKSLAKEVCELANVVVTHHKTPHFWELVKSTKFWLLGLAAFVLFHTIATEIEAHGSNWIHLLLKWIGAE